MAFLPNNLRLTIFSARDIPEKKNLYCTHLFSITHPGNKQPPIGINNFLTNPKVYKYNFHDVFTKEQLESKMYTPPSYKDIKSLVDIGHEIKEEVENGKDISLFFHCQAGISRSTAAACIVLNSIFGPGFELPILQEIYKIRPIMRPNSLMISIADKILHRDGKMIDANKEAHSFVDSSFKGSLWI